MIKYLLAFLLLVSSSYGEVVKLTNHNSDNSLDQYSGVVIGKFSDGNHAILTCAHGFHPTYQSSTVQWYNNTQVPAKALKVSHDLDLALLKAKLPSEPTNNYIIAKPVISVNKDGLPVPKNIGSGYVKVTRFKEDKSKEWRVIDGRLIINQSFNPDNGLYFATFTAPLINGDSGSPIFNDRGEIFTILSASDKDSIGPLPEQIHHFLSSYTQNGNIANCSKPAPEVVSVPPVDIPKVPPTESVCKCSGMKECKCGDVKSCNCKYTKGCECNYEDRIKNLEKILSAVDAQHKDWYNANRELHAKVKSLEAEIERLKKIPLVVQLTHKGKELDLDKFMIFDGQVVVIDFEALVKLIKE